MYHCDHFNIFYATVAYILTISFAKIVSKIYKILNIIFRFTKFRLTLHKALRFQSTVVVLADQNLLDAINIGGKNLLDTINIDKPLDISLVGITQNTSVRITQETPVPTKEIEKNKESESTISDIEDYINSKYDELAVSSLKKELLQEVHLLIQKEENSIISFLQNQNDHLLTEVNFLREEVKEKKTEFLKNLWITVDKISILISITIRIPSVLMISPKNLLKIQMVSIVFPLQ